MSIDALGWITFGAASILSLDRFLDRRPIIAAIYFVLAVSCLVAMNK